VFKAKSKSKRKSSSKSDISLPNTKLRELSVPDNEMNMESLKIAEEMFQEMMAANPLFADNEDDILNEADDDLAENAAKKYYNNEINHMKDEYEANAQEKEDEIAFLRKQLEETKRQQAEQMKAAQEAAKKAEAAQKRKAEKKKSKAKPENESAERSGNSMELAESMFQDLLGADANALRHSDELLHDDKDMGDLAKKHYDKQLGQLEEKFQGDVQAKEAEIEALKLKLQESMAKAAFYLLIFIQIREDLALNSNVLEMHFLLLELILTLKLPNMQESVVV